MPESLKVFLNVEHFRRSFVPAAIRLYNSKGDHRLSPQWAPPHHPATHITLPHSIVFIVSAGLGLGLGSVIIQLYYIFYNSLFITLYFIMLILYLFSKYLIHNHIVNYDFLDIHFTLHHTYPILYHTALFYTISSYNMYVCMCVYI